MGSVCVLQIESPVLLDVEAFILDFPSYPSSFVAGLLIGYSKQNQRLGEVGAAVDGVDGSTEPWNSSSNEAERAVRGPKGSGGLYGSDLRAKRASSR